MCFANSPMMEWCLVCLHPFHLSLNSEAFTEVSFGQDSKLFLADFVCPELGSGCSCGRLLLLFLCKASHSLLRELRYYRSGSRSFFSPQISGRGCWVFNKQLKCPGNSWVNKVLKEASWGGGTSSCPSFSVLVPMWPCGSWSLPLHQVNVLNNNCHVHYFVCQWCKFSQAGVMSWVGSVACVGVEHAKAVSEFSGLLQLGCAQQTKGCPTLLSVLEMC